MYHSLLVASLIIAELGHLLQCLANSGDIAMAKDTKASGEKGLFSPVAFHVLVFEKGDDGLGHRQTFCCLFGHVCSPIILDTITKINKIIRRGRFIAPSADLSALGGC